MSTVIKPYAEYKDSGVAWLGEVPASWDVLPAVAAYRPKQMKNTRLIEKVVLSLSYGQIVVKPEERLHGLVPDSFETYQIIEPGDIIVRATDLQNDKTSLRIGYSNYRGIITSAYMCLETTDRISSEFGYQFLNAYDRLKIIYGFGSGLRQNLDFRDIKRMPVLVPPEGEQSAIVRFLGFADRRIRQCIFAKQKLIKLLEEEKQAIVDRIVARGLDPQVRLKPSGVEWLGAVPAHWRVTKLASLATRIGDGLHGTPEYVDESPYPFINGNNLSNGSVRITPSTRCVSEHEYRTHYIPLDESTVLLSINGTIGNVAIYRNEQVILGKSAAYINCKQALCREYLFFFLQSAAVREHFRREVTGTTIFNLSLASIRALPVTLPTTGEQLEISQFLQMKTAKSSEAIEKVIREIGLLREYRTCLIGDVITGKLDVREAAANLSDEVGEPDGLPLADEPLDGVADDAELESDDLAEEVVA